MTNIDCNKLSHKEINEKINKTDDKFVILNNVIGQRFIAAGLFGKNININGTPGNAIGAYLDGAKIEIKGNAQDATGDTMNDGSITIYGNSGDATGYAMRGGEIYIKGDVGYRAGIHMKAYKDKIPHIVIGGKAGSFLGEYQAGGIILVLGLKNDKNDPPISNFCGTGMHGGKIYIRTDKKPEYIDREKLIVEKVNDKKEIAELIKKFCDKFEENEKEILDSTFYVIKPNTNNPYKQLYTKH